MTKKIVCYGDSNTWGYVPGCGLRFAPDVRWPGVLAALLGEGYAVREEGMSGRTTAYDVPWAPVRSGSDYLHPCLLTNKPMDLLIIMLGTNDLGLTDAAGVKAGMRKLLDITRHVDGQGNENTRIFPNGEKILIVSPVLVDPRVRERDVVDRIKGMAERSLGMAKALRELSEETGVYFMDAAQYAAPSLTDCIHLDADGHNAIAHALAKKIKEEIFALGSDNAESGG